MLISGSSVDEVEQPLSEVQGAAAHCLKLPGRKLYLTPLNNAKRLDLESLLDLRVSTSVY